MAALKNTTTFKSINTNKIIAQQLLENNIQLGNIKKNRTNDAVPFIYQTNGKFDVFDIQKTLKPLKRILYIITSLIARKGFILIKIPYANTRNLKKYFFTAQWRDGFISNFKGKKTILERIPNFMFIINNYDNLKTTIYDELHDNLIPSASINDSNNKFRSLYPIPGNNTTLYAQKFYVKILQKAIFAGLLKEIAYLNRISRHKKRLSS